ncbi:hypothetical protein MtrunA17_Chr1g0176521 [Medicago truncatula]|uniref:Uncharacterized protein n=1 Tax=Medicago truncatula TaxID=3880 RepID=A0A396JPL2_MEDTR|nr:hypothetical protein MtrunA17_Chr1g0176521 [Medicago truncatula]
MDTQNQITYNPQNESKLVSVFIFKLRYSTFFLRQPKIIFSVQLFRILIVTHGAGLRSCSDCPMVGANCYEFG